MLGYLSVGIILVLTAWVLIFYAFMTEEVYDNIDDGLKNSKTEIIKKAYTNPQVESFLPFGTSGFRITPLAPGKYTKKNVFTTEMIYMDVDDNEEPVRMLTTTFVDQKGDHYQLEIRTSTIEADDLLRDFGVAVLALYFALLLSIYLINHFILRRAVWNPFYRLLHNLRTYTLGEKISTAETQTPIKEFTDLQREINKIVKAIIEDFEDLFSYKNISVTLQDTGEAFTMLMDKGLAITLVQNLLKNALIHNIPQGSIVIELQHNAFTIANTSAHYTALDESVIYNRFFRSTTNDESTGLGLSLVQTIIKVTESLHIRYEFDQLHRFTVYQSNGIKRNKD